MLRLTESAPQREDLALESSRVILSGIRVCFVAEEVAAGINQPVPVPLPLKYKKPSSFAKSRM